MLSSSRPERDPEDASACRARALGLLARREHSRRELQRKLQAKGFLSAVVEAVLDALEASGALANERFVASFVESRVARGQGPLRIRAELARRGIAGHDIGAALAAGWNWVEAAGRARVKRFGASPPEGFDERARQARFLERRGFDAGQINAALDLAADCD